MNNAGIVDGGDADRFAEGEFDGVEDVAPPSRMIVAFAALIGVMISAYTLMFKLGIIGSLVCGSGSCERVQLSPWATQLGVPVPVWGVLGYGVMLVVALTGLQPRHVRTRWVSVILLTGATFALVFTLYLSYLEANVIHAWCRWCVASAINVVVMFLAALPEIRRVRSPA